METLCSTNTEQHHQPMTWPSARGSDPPQSTPVLGFLQIICPRPNTARLCPPTFARTAWPRFSSPSAASMLKPSSKSTLRKENYAL